MKDYFIEEKNFNLKNSLPYFEKYKKNTLYSEGDDFTMPRLSSYQPSSTFLAFYDGRAKEHWYSEETKFKVYEILDQRREIVGVVMHWMEPFCFEVFQVKEVTLKNKTPKLQVPFVYLGQAGCFLKKEHRGKGLVKFVFDNHLKEYFFDIQEEAKKMNALPCISASWATAKLLNPYLHEGIMLYDGRILKDIFPLSSIDKIYFESLFDEKLFSSLPIPGLIDEKNKPKGKTAGYFSSSIEKFWFKKQNYDFLNKKDKPIKTIKQRF